MKCRIFGEHIVFAVTYTRVERTLFVDINGQRPSILDTPLCRVRFITDFTVDPLVDKFNFGPAVLASGFLDDGFKPPFSRVATIRFCTTFCQLAHLGFNIGYYFSPLAPGRTPACHEPGQIQLTHIKWFIPVTARRCTQFRYGANGKKQHKES